MCITFPIAVAVGAMLGFFAGLGVGGGSLLMLWLTLVAGIDTASARAVNLMFFVPCALCSSIFRLKQGNLPIKKLLLPIALGCTMAAGGSLVARYFNTEALSKIFGALLLFTGVRELTVRGK